MKLKMMQVVNQTAYLMKAFFNFPEYATSTWFCVQDCLKQNMVIPEASLPRPTLPHAETEVSLLLVIFVIKRHKW